MANRDSGSRQLVAGRRRGEGVRDHSHPLKHNQPVTSPTVDGDLLAVITGADRLRNGAMPRLIGSGAATEVEILWQTQRMIPQVASPVLYQGLLYTVSDKGVMVCYDPLTGAVRWQNRLEGRGFRSSLLAGEGKIYALDSYGRAAVVAAKREFELIAENDLDEYGNASPAYGQTACWSVRTERCFASSGQAHLQHGRRPTGHKRTPRLA